MDRYTLFVSLTNNSGTEVCRGIYARGNKWENVKDEEHILVEELEMGMKCLVLENIGDGTGERGTFGSMVIPKNMLDNCVVTIYIHDIET